MRASHCAQSHRAIKIPSSELRVQLEAARGEGRLIDLPPHDWPPHDKQPRRVLADERERQAVAIREVFGATRCEAELLLTMLMSGSALRSRYASPDAFDVHIHHLRRRVAPFGITIVTVSGYGYRLSAEDRERLMNMLAQTLSAE
jgi:hypothetical protein